jgi:hypothetical protein
MGLPQACRNRTVQALTVQALVLMSSHAAQPLTFGSLSSSLTSLLIEEFRDGRSVWLVVRHTSATPACHEFVKRKIDR